MYIKAVRLNGQTAFFHFQHTLGTFLKDNKSITIFILNRKGDDMSKQKIEPEFIYHEFGFPIILRQVPMIELRGVWTPDIDFNVLQKVVLLALSHHPVDLTGNQIHFIRMWLGLTQIEFGKLFGVTHPAVVKWEKTENKSSKISLSTQRDLRLFLLDQLLIKDEDFRKAFKTVHITKYTSTIRYLEIDVPTDLIAI